MNTRVTSILENESDSSESILTNGLVATKHASLRDDVYRVNKLFVRFNNRKTEREYQTHAHSLAVVYYRILIYILLFVVAVCSIIIYLVFPRGKSRWEDIPLVVLCSLSACCSIVLIIVQYCIAKFERFSALSWYIGFAPSFLYYVACVLSTGSPAALHIGMYHPVALMVVHLDPPSPDVFTYGYMPLMLMSCLTIAAINVYVEGALVLWYVLPLAYHCLVEIPYCLVLIRTTESSRMRAYAALKKYGVYGARLRRENKRLEGLLTSLFPKLYSEGLYEELTSDAGLSGVMYECGRRGLILILTDIVSFSAFSRTCPLDQLFMLINEIYDRFGGVVSANGFDRAMTMGDGYLITSRQGEGAVIEETIGTALNICVRIKEVMRAIRGSSSGLLAVPPGMCVQEITTQSSLRVRIGAIVTDTVVMAVIAGNHVTFDCYGEDIGLLNSLEHACGNDSICNVNEAFYVNGAKGLATMAREEHLPNSDTPHYQILCLDKAVAGPRLTKSRKTGLSGGLKNPQSLSDGQSGEDPDNTPREPKGLETWGWLDMTRLSKLFDKVKVGYVRFLNLLLVSSFAVFFCANFTFGPYAVVLVCVLGGFLAMQIMCTVALTLPCSADKLHGGGGFVKWMIVEGVAYTCMLVAILIIVSPFNGTASAMAALGYVVCLIGLFETRPLPALSGSGCASTYLLPACLAATTALPLLFTSASIVGYCLWETRSGSGWWWGAVGTGATSLVATWAVGLCFSIKERVEVKGRNECLSEILGGVLDSQGCRKLVEVNKKLLLSHVPESIYDTIITNPSHRVEVRGVAAFIKINLFAKHDEVIDTLFAVKGVLTMLDAYSSEHQCQRIKVTNMKYFVCSGFVGSNDDYITDMLKFVLLCIIKIPDKATGVTVKIGLDMGPLIGGMIGRTFDVFGSSVNMASRLTDRAIINTILLKNVELKKAFERLGQSCLLFEKMEDKGIKGFPGSFDLYQFCKVSE